MSDATPLPRIVAPPGVDLGHDCEWEDGGTIVVHKNGEVQFVDDDIDSRTEVPTSEKN
jgi:hypothetical protein